MLEIDLYEPEDAEVPTFKIHNELTKAREIEETSQFTLLSNVPKWIRDRGQIDDYKRQMSMSTVSCEYYNPHFNTAAVWYMISRLRNVDLDGGRILDVSSADATTDPTGGKPVKTGPRKGRNPINPPRERRRTHGQYKSFGTSIEISMLVKLPKGPDFDPSIREREFKVKLFATNVQIPGCGNEDMTDVKHVINFVDTVFKIAYNNVIPRPPPDFMHLQNLLVAAGENPLKYPMPQHYEEIEYGKTHIYSRNYTFHYIPLVNDVDENGQNRRAINLSELTKYLYDHPEQNEKWFAECGLIDARIVHNQTSDSSNRRAQFIFHTPQFVREGTNRVSQHLTKASVESSGKINIELSNNYYWRDTLWRIFAYLSSIVGHYYVQPRMSSVVNRATSNKIREMFQAQPIEKSEVYAFLASIDSSETTSEEEDCD